MIFSRRVPVFLDYYLFMGVIIMVISDRLINKNWYPEISSSCLKWKLKGWISIKMELYINKTHRIMNIQVTFVFLKHSYKRWRSLKCDLHELIRSYLYHLYIRYIYNFILRLTAIIFALYLDIFNYLSSQRDASEKHPQTTWSFGIWS